MSAPRILLLVKGLRSGGTQRILLDAVRHFDREAFAYEVAFVVDALDDMVPRFEDLGVPVHRLGGRGWPVRLRRLVARRGIRLVHVHSPLTAAGARLVLRVPIVYTEHNVWASYHPATRLANAVTFGRNAHAFAVSRAVAASTRGKDVEVLYHGVDLDSAPEVEGAAPGAEGAAPEGPRAAGEEQAGPLVVGTVGELRPEKGHRFLLEAAERLPHARFVIVGDGALADELRRTAPPNVELLGHRDDAARLAGTFDVVALPSLHEGLPIALLEAMAQGRPVVASRAGGVGEVIEDGQSGVLVEPGDPVALAAAIGALLADDDLRDRLGAAARERVAAFDIGAAARRMEQVYEELLG